MKSKTLTEKSRDASSYEERLFGEKLWWMASDTGLYTYDPQGDVVRFYSDDKKEVGTILKRRAKS